ncbi:hypothetical protein Btru_042903 [Bulinus truncatus]|nr:hypothetical protein Btru_042903 [Bulinus truncatus]
MASRGVTFAAFVLITSATILSVMYFLPGAIVCLNPPLNRRGGPIQTSQEVKDIELLISKPAGTQEDIGGGPLRFVRENGHVDDLPSLDLMKLTTEQLRMTMHSYLDNTDKIKKMLCPMANTVMVSGSDTGTVINFKISFHVSQNAKPKKKIWI